MFHETSYARSDVATWGVLRVVCRRTDCASVLHAASSRFYASGIVNRERLIGQRTRLIRDTAT